MPKRPRFVRAWTLAALAFAIALTGCSTSTEVRSATSPPGEVRMIAVGRIHAASPEWERLARRLRQDLVSALDREAKGVAVTQSVPPRLPPDAVLLAGSLEDAESGNELVATLIGYGVGGASLTGRFTVRGSDGVTLAEFDTTVSADDPAAESVVIGGLGTHMRPFYLDDLTGPLADEVAALILDWTAGERLD